MGQAANNNKVVNLFFFILIFWSVIIQPSYSQKLNLNSPEFQEEKEFHKTKNINLERKIIITDQPGKDGQEVEDTTIFINSELNLYAALYHKGKYKSEAFVDWFWADISYSSGTSEDSSIFLGAGSNLTFQPTKSDTGFIYVQSTPSVTGDSTGIITILSGEELILISTYSNHTEITQGQNNIFVSLRVQNVGSIPSYIHDVSLKMIAPNSQIVTDEYQISRTDTITRIRSGQTRDFTFLVNTDLEADTVLVSIDGNVITRDNIYTNCQHKHQWQVQSSPQLKIDLIEVLTDEVFQGQEGLVVLMHITNNGMASVNTIKPELTFLYNGQNVTADYEYKMSENNPQIIAGHSSAKIELIVRVMPFATLGIIIINGNISALDTNTGLLYSDEGADVTASWVVTLTSAEVIITSTIIDCPNITGQGDGEVNINQQYAVKVTVRNRGGEDIENVGVTLVSSGTSIFYSDTIQVIRSISVKQDCTITYNLSAYSDTLPSIERFTARIDSATSALSGGGATIAPSLDSLAQVEIEMPANLDLKLKNTYLQIPVGQVFDVKANVYNAAGNADYDSSGTLTISLPAEYELTAGIETQFFRDNKDVIWKVQPPIVSQGPDSILVYISQRPRDQNNPIEYARVTTDSVIMIVQTLETVLTITDVSISDPSGAIDGILSTEQDFVVTGKIVKQSIENVCAQITGIPLGYKLKSEAQQDLQADTVVTWRLQTPDSAHHIGEKIVIKAWGNEENDSTKIYSTYDSSRYVSTVKKANLIVHAEIVSPPSAVNGQIYPGLEFRIKGEISNTGEANIYGNKSLILDPQDVNSFTVLGDSLLPVTGDFVEWTIRASENLGDQGKIIKVRIHDIPNDENTDSTAYIEEDHKVYEIPVLSATGIGRLELMVKKLPNIAPATIAPGETYVLMGIECTNLAIVTGFPIKIRLLKFNIEDRNNNLIAPSSVLSGFRVRNNESVLGQVTTLLQNPVEIPFTTPITLAAQETDQFFMEIDFHENQTQQFKINLKDSSYINALSPIKIHIVDEFRNSSGVLNLRSHCPVITQKEFKKSFGNYPNPFGNQGRKQTYFVYYLPQDADIELNIYTLIGELVWNCSYTKSQPQGKKGLHQGKDIIWNGKNLEGYEVLNGVYIARIKTDYGDWAITKIAVLK